VQLVDHQAMVIDMNETQVRTLEQARQVLQGTQALQLSFAQPEDSCIVLPSKP
jgi:hypothetical protein